MKYAVVLLVMMLGVLGCYFLVFHVLESPVTAAETTSSSESQIAVKSSKAPETVPEMVKYGGTEPPMEEITTVPEPETLPPETEYKPAYDPAEDWSLLLVNYENLLPEGYQFEPAVVEGNFTFDSRAVGALKQMLADGRAQGHSLQVVSTYRTVERSELLYNNKISEYVSLGYNKEDAAVEAAKWVAPPRESEHNAGLSIDVVSSDYYQQYSDLQHEYENFASFQWLSENCQDYGFVLRYPKDKQDITHITYEPWHYRYVGVEHAKLMKEKGFCLEEYLEWLKK